MVEGESPYKLAPGVLHEDEADKESESEGDEAGGAETAGTVFRLIKGQLRRLDGGMEQYAELAARTAARLGKAASVA